MGFDVDPKSNRNTPKNNDYYNNYYHSKPIKRLFLMLEKCHRLKHLELEFEQKIINNNDINNNNQIKRAFHGTPLPPNDGTPSTSRSSHHQHSPSTSHSLSNHSPSL